jgi:hypothetical protein
MPEQQETFTYQYGHGDEHIAWFDGGVKFA